MKKKNVVIGLSAVGILGGAGYFLAPVIEESVIERAVDNGEGMKLDKFIAMKEVPVEILDTSAFNDENLEKWFVENQVKKGEFTYFDNTHTYILVSAGDKGKENDLIWLDGIRMTGKKLIVGYEFKDGDEFGVKSEKGRITSLLMRTEGNFKDVSGVVVIKPEAKPNEPKVTETVVEGEEAVKKAESAEKKEEAVEKEVEKDVEKDVEQEEKDEVEEKKEVEKSDSDTNDASTEKADEAE